MTITYSYIITGFNSRNGALYLDVSATDGEFLTTQHCAFWSQFRGYGVLPTGPALEADLMAYSANVISAGDFERIKAVNYYGPDPAMIAAIQALVGGGSTVTIALHSVAYFTAVNSLEIVDTVPITVGMTFTAMSNTYTVTNVSGTTVSFTPSAVFTPNFTPGTVLTFTL